MAGSDELRAKRAHKKKAFAVNDMTVAIGIASVLALFIFLAVNQTSQVKEKTVTTQERTIKLRSPYVRIVSLHLAHAHHSCQCVVFDVVCVNLNQGPLNLSSLQCVDILVPSGECAKAQLRNEHDSRSDASLQPTDATTLAVVFDAVHQAKAVKKALSCSFHVKS